MKVSSSLIKWTFFSSVFVFRCLQSFAKCPKISHIWHCTWGLPDCWFGWIFFFLNPFRSFANILFCCLVLVLIILLKSSSSTAWLKSTSVGCFWFKILLCLENLLEWLLSILSFQFLFMGLQEIHELFDCQFFQVFGFFNGYDYIIEFGSRDLNIFSMTWTSVKVSPIRLSWFTITISLVW